MRHYRYTTQTPNVLMDYYLKNLSGSELKVVLVILRRTIGMADKEHQGKRKQQAWISQKLFMLITGLSNRAVSRAIETLTSKSLIVVRDEYGRTLHSKVSRKAASRLYYALSAVVLVAKPAPESGLQRHIPVKKGHTIKLSRDTIV